MLCSVLVGSRTRTRRSTRTKARTPTDKLAPGTASCISPRQLERPRHQCGKRTTIARRRPRRWIGRRRPDGRRGTGRRCSRPIPAIAGPTVLSGPRFQFRPLLRGLHQQPRTRDAPFRRYVARSIYPIAASSSTKVPRAPRRAKPRWSTRIHMHARPHQRPWPPETRVR